MSAVVDNAHGIGGAPHRATSGRVSFRSVGKIYDPDGAAVTALEDFSLEMAAGDFVALVGPSGCGKSTLLNILAGFDAPTSGSVQLDGAVLADAGRGALPGPDRVVVFQQGSLFPWRTVLDNVTYGLLKQRRTDPATAKARAMALLAAAGNLDQIADAYPAQLSSGMQRRVEILRALINDPKILLLDEPFRAMDTVTKGAMHRHLLDLHAAKPVSILFITHDVDEALLLADRVIVMTTRPGRVKLDLAIDLPRPRTRAMMTSDGFLGLRRQAMASVREEARKAFARSEQELA